MNRNQQYIGAARTGGWNPSRHGSLLRRFAAAALVSGVLLSSAGCEPNDPIEDAADETENAADEIENAANSAGDAIEDAADEVEDEID